MKSSARISLYVALILAPLYPCWASISVNWLGEPINLASELSSVQALLDMNADGIDDFVFSASVSFAGVRSAGANQYLIWPSPPPNIGGDVESLDDGFEIGPNSGNGALDWFNHPTEFAPLIICLDGPGGSTCVGRFRIPGDVPPILGQRAYVGVEFQIQDATHYGWIDIAVGNLSPGVEIYGWAYETEPSVSILAGAVPEPTTVFLFTGGGIVLFLIRWRARTRWWSM